MNDEISKPARCAHSSVLIRCYKCDRQLEQEMFSVYIYHMVSPEDAVCCDCDQLIERSCGCGN